MKALNILAAALLAGAATPSIAAPAPAQGKPDAAPARDAAEVPLSRAFMIGSWTDDGDCDHAVEFLGDGRYFAGDRGGIWQLDGHQLTMTGEAILTIDIVPLDRDTIGVVSEDGALGQSIRCASGPESPLPGPDETA